MGERVANRYAECFYKSLGQEIVGHSKLIDKEIETCNTLLKCLSSEAPYADLVNAPTSEALLRRLLKTRLCNT
ncbi:unnamed protein product [Anisakis simplex]|uniref:ATP synthase subunit delta n=1 Tax=Anisakis simplex TaxID=6269 RepID=A0A0M3JCM3_ANISI|nr:unnamed protein product [Anisakis simplex]